jgi:Lanthionine synthetase C-like protein
LLLRNRAALKAFGDDGEEASYLMGDTPILMLAQGDAPTASRADALAALIQGNLDHPARELMWGAPGTLLAALFLHERNSSDARWAALFRATAARLWSQLQWSAEHGCAYWTQDLYGRRCNYLDAVHGFVATASPLIRGRHLLDAPAWNDWQQCIINTVQRTATREGELANWRPLLDTPAGQAPRLLMQFCHGAPGFVNCLADMHGAELDALLIAAGEATWAAGPLAKGSNLCHGTGGNGYALLKLFERTGDARWLERARAFAMHAIAQMQADAQQVGQLRYSLWTGDPGLAIYLWDCLRSRAAFPTLDVFYS